MAAPANERDQPLGIGVGRAPDAEAKPDRIHRPLASAALFPAPLRPFPRPPLLATAATAFAGIKQILRRGETRAMQANEGRGDALRTGLIHDQAGQGEILFGRGFGEDGIVEQALLIAGADRFGAGRGAPGGVDIGRGQDLLGPPAARVGDQQHRHPLLARPARSAAAVEQALPVRGEIGVNH